MMYHKIIVDADLCLKLGRSTLYPYLEILLPLLANNIYEVVNREIMTDRAQLDKLLRDGKVTILSERDLEQHEQTLYHATHALLSKVMIDPATPHKNRGEVCSLAMAKTKGIPYFATDERHLQPIIDANLNTGLGGDLRCVRIVDIVELIKQGKLDGLQRKDAKLIWIIAKKSKIDFNESIWPT